MRAPLLAPLLCALCVLAVPLAAGAAGKHDKLQCAGCHTRKDIMAGNRVDLDPATKQPYAGSTAVCLACHQTSEAGGNGAFPVKRHLSHPYGLASVNPRIARVPAPFLVQGRFECTSCHDPHPSNVNYKYLRTAVGPKGEQLDRICAMCHLTKSG